MRIGSRCVLGLTLATVALAAGLVASDASGQPADVRTRAEPSMVRVEIESLEAVRGVRFVGPIVQSVQPVGSGTKPAATVGGVNPYWTNWNGDTLAISGNLPTQEPLAAWLDASFDGRVTTKDVSVVAVDAFARELWRWRFTDCAPVQLAYDVEAGTWTLRMSFARMRYQSAPVVPDPVVADVARPSRSDERAAVAGPAFLRLTLTKGTALEASRFEPSDVEGEVAVTPRGGGRIAIPWAEIKRVEPVTDTPVAR
jgi:hypothetical protein